MTFSINQMIVDGNENVVALSWAYTNADGTLSNQLKLATPYGDVALASVTQELAVSWLVAQIGNTAAEFDAAIANRKAETEYAATLVAYEDNGAGAFEVVETPAEPVAY
jgi:hypothetical protein